MPTTIHKSRSRKSGTSRRKAAAKIAVALQPRFPGFDGGDLPIFSSRRRLSSIHRDWRIEEFCSDKSRIVFCSSFRRMMQKAQVFSLESNTSVRNRLTHSLEVADIGRTLGRKVGQRLQMLKIGTAEETECIQAIVESACLLHDIGNPPFGHFGEEAIKHWFSATGNQLFHAVGGLQQIELISDATSATQLNDFALFDGNPQGFRIATRLHCEMDLYALNLTRSTLLASIKYPNAGVIANNALFPKKLGIFSSEAEVYQDLCVATGTQPGHRYFLAYLMELADDICYCTSDIADSFEKRIITSAEFLGEFKAICKENNVDHSFLPKKIENFSYEVSIGVARKLIDEAVQHFCENLRDYIRGDARELSEDLASGALLKCFKAYARRFIYTDPEAQRIEIAGSRVVETLMTHFGRLLKISRQDFSHFVQRSEMRKGSALDTEWRIYNQLSKRMLTVYKQNARHATDREEWIARARLVVDYVSGLTDQSALEFYQNLMAIRV